MSRGCVGRRVRWGTRREGNGSKGARFSTLVVFASFRSLFGIKFPYFGEGTGDQNPVMNSVLV